MCVFVICIHAVIIEVIWLKFKVVNPVKASFYFRKFYMDFHIIFSEVQYSM